MFHLTMCFLCKTSIFYLKKKKKKKESLNLRVYILAIKALLAQTKKCTFRTILVL